jgi:HK97 gp10 family phage protein
VSVEVVGTKEIERILEDIAPRHARNLMRATVHGIAGEITKKAKAYAPKGNSGVLKKAIYTKRRKSPPEKPVSEVKIHQGSGAKYDAFYWRFVEYGTGGGRGSHLPMLENDDGTRYPGARPFILPAKEQVRSKMEQITKTQFSKKLENAIKRELKKARKK